MKNAAFLKLLFAGAFFAVLVTGAFAADPPPSEISPTNTNAVSIVDVQRACLRLQEEIQATQLALERGQQDARAAIQRSFEDMVARFEALEQSMNARRTEEFRAMQRMNHLVLTVAGAFVAVVFIALLFISYFQWRVASRLAELSSVRPTLLTMANSRALPAGGQVVEQASARLLGVVEQLQLRIFELEKNAHAPVKADVEPAAANAGKM